MEALRGEVLFIYSGAHLDDLKNSPKEYRDQDLKLMEDYVGDNYFNRNPIDNITSCHLAKPADAYESIDYEAMDETLNNFDLDTLLFKDLDDSEESKIAKGIIESIFNRPLSSFGLTIDTTNMAEASKEWFDKVFPTYNPGMSLKDFMNAVMPYGGLLLRDAKEITEMRKHIQQYLNSETYNFQTWGMEFNERMKDKFGKTFMETIDAMITEKQKNDFFIRFNYAYTMLEMFNITREKSGKKAKKFNYWSLNNDATHCYFASMCDYLITDDKGLQVKASILYRLFNIETRIFSTKDFVEQQNEFLIKENTINDFNKNLEYNIRHSELVSIETLLENKNVIGHYKLKRIQLSFFNELHIIRYPHNKYSTCILSFRRPPIDNKIILMYREIELIVAKLYRLFGNDDNGRGLFDFGEQYANGKALRVWSMPSVEFQLIFQEDSGWLYIDLHIHIMNDNDLMN